MWRMLWLFLPLVWAQIQIQSGDLPTAGTDYTLSQSRPRPGLDFLATGANYTWDFSSLSADTQLVVQWKSPIQVPQYILSCGNASLQALLLKLADSLPSGGGITIRDLYAFLRKGSSKMTVEGVGASVNGVPITQCYQDPDEIYVLPLNYGNRDSTTFWLRLTFQAPNGGTVTFAQRGYRIHQVDGYGQVTTPYGQFSCLRLRRDVHRKDTVYYQGFPVQWRDTSYTELEWLGTGQGVPLLRVEGSFILGNFTPTIIQYKDNTRSSFLSLASGTVRVGPNPARGMLYIEPARGHFVVRSLIGEVLLEGEVPPDGKLQLPPTLPEGVYFLRLSQDQRVSWHRFVLIR